ncbi:ubiquitin C-terminal hydrolase 12-like isoform X2 [Lotus japonicus]|nr:ubiquitin C-terminal hydrolase 12-like isoform X2 [Lotus japonicus]
MEQIGKCIYFDLVDFSKVFSFHVQSQTPFNLFKVVVANEFGFPVQRVRFWTWEKRENGTIRPYQPLTEEEENNHVEKLKNRHDGELKLFLEVEFQLDLHPTFNGNENILLFIKLYDPMKEELRYAGRLVVELTAKPLTIIEKLNQMVGFPFSCDEEIELYEVCAISIFICLVNIIDYKMKLKHHSIECQSQLSTHLNFGMLFFEFQEIRFMPLVLCEQLENGDILCFQRSAHDSDTDCLLPNIPSFLEHMHNRQVVCFRSLERPNDEGFYLELSKANGYDDIVKRLARHIGLDDPSKIRLTSHNCFSRQPNPDPIRYRGVKNLLDMLVNCNQTSVIMYYEVLDIPLPQLQDLKCLRVAFYYSTKNEVLSYLIRMPNHSTVMDMISQLKNKLQLSSPDANLKLLQVLDHKIYKTYSYDEKIGDISSHHTLRVVEIPDEKSLGPSDILIPVSHFFRETGPKNHNQMKIKRFGEPFMLVIHEGETLAKVKVKIQSKLHVPAKDFDKWKFAFLSLDDPNYLQDSDVLSSRFQRKDVSSWDQTLGLEHNVNDPRIVYALDQVCTADPQPEEVPPKHIGELVDFRGLAKIDKVYLPSLDEVCTWHPALIECQQKRSDMFKQWAFTTLGQVLHFLKPTKPKDMTGASCQHLLSLWEELVESSGFGLTWLEPHVQHAFEMKSYFDKANKVRKLKDKVKAFYRETRCLRVKRKFFQLGLELARNNLAKEEEGYEERDLDTVLGYGTG